MKDWGADKYWADLHLAEIERVIREQARQIIKVNVSSSEKDRKFATDYEIKVVGGDVACRIRKWAYWHQYGDLTLRYTRPNGQETEVAKIMRGYGDWYLYAWARPDATFGAWVFVDLHRLRKTSLIGAADIQCNWDGSSQFKCIALPDLFREGCIVGVGGDAVKRLVEAIEKEAA